MLDSDTHLAQAKHNEEFFVSVEQGVYGDWAVTALFYSALHYVDAFLARKKKYPGNHPDRDRLILLDPTANQVRSNYRRLADWCHDARYKARAFSPGQISSLHRNDFEVVKREMTRSQGPFG